MGVLLLVAIWVVACSLWDMLEYRVPNLLLALGVFGALLIRISILHVDAMNAIPPILLTVAAWVLALLFWLAGWWGAADAKFWMALSLAFPDLTMLLLLALVNLAAGLLLPWMFSRSSRWPLKKLPAVPLLGAGWLAWAGIVLLTGRLA